MLHLATFVRRSAGIPTTSFRHTCLIALQQLVMVAVTNPVFRRWLNAFYMTLSWSSKSDFHRRFSQLFRGRKARFSSARWTVEFAGKQITMPLRSERLWLDWDSAVSICGHDIEVKQTYGSLIRSRERPALFLDVGANYGTHSLLFLVHGIKTITFEPNVSCHDDFLAYCRANGVEPWIEPIALGEHEGLVDLWYPENDTWLGSTDTNARLRLQAQEGVSVQTVMQKTIDHYFSDYGDHSLLIKIDTEGNECAVLKGGRRTLKEKRPLIIFEAWEGNQRSDLFVLLSQFDYIIAELPWAENEFGKQLSREQFVTSAATNFIAVSKGRSCTK